MFKLYIFLIFTYCTIIPIELIIQFGNCKIFKKSNSQNKNNFQYLFGWDLHDVIFIKKHHKRALNFIQSSFYHYGFFSNIKHLNRIKSVKKKYDQKRSKEGLSQLSWEEFFYILLRSTNKEDQECARYIINCIKDDGYVVDPQIANIIYKLSELGYKHAVLSNMFPSLLNSHIDTLLTTYQSHNLSEKEITPLINMLAHQSNRVIPHEGNNWKHKPEADIYHEFFLKNLSSNISKNNFITIFIDDKESNVKAALENGFDIGIVYTNPEEFKKALLYLGINI